MISAHVSRSKMKRNRQCPTKTEKRLWNKSRIVYPTSKGRESSEQLVKQLRNYSRRDINKNNNAIKEALKALEARNRRRGEEREFGDVDDVGSFIGERNYKHRCEKLNTSALLDSKNSRSARGMMEQKR